MMAKLSDLEDMQCVGFEHDHYHEAACAYHEEHMMHDCVQLDHVVDSRDEYTHDSNIIMCDQYVRDNEVPIVHHGASSVPTDAFMMIYDDMCEPHDQSVSYPSRNTVVKNSLTADLAIYKEHVELYEQRAKFELTEREQKINEQLRIVISDRNFKEETLKRDLLSIKLQLASTIKHNKINGRRSFFSKKDFKQKENNYLADFLNIKPLKEKVEDKLIKQDKSLQTIHMLCKPRPNSNELKRVAIGYKNPLCLTRAKQAQPALYNGHEIIKENHMQAIVHNSEDTLEISEITRKKMNDKMNDPECVTHKVKIAPHDYSKDNLLATFTPQKQLTPEQIFWSNDLIKIKSKALKERTKVSRPIKAFTVPPTPDKATPDFDSVFVIGKMQASLQEKDHTTDSQITKLTDQVTHVQAQNDLFRAENDKIKQHYKELYDSIKITRAKHIEQVTKVTTENMNLKTGVSKATVNPLVFARDKHAIYVEPIVPLLRNNRNAHLDYLRHPKESVETIRDIIEEAKVVRPLDKSIVSACHYTKQSQELLEYAIGTYKMADVNAPSNQTATMDPPVRTDDQILSYIRAFTASSNLPSIYIQQFWDTILYDKKAGCYKCQLDEQWFDLTNETLREALQITHVNHNQASAAPPSINGLIDFINQLGYPKLVINLSAIVTNDMFQPIWEEFAQSIHTFIEDKRNLSRHTSGKKMATLIVIPSIQFTKLIIHHLQRKHRFHPRPDSLLHLSNEEHVLGYLKFSAKGTKREIFEMPIPGRLIAANNRAAPYYQEYQENVAKHRGFLAGKTRSTQDLPAPRPAKPARKPQSTTQKAPPKPSISSPITSTQPAPTSVLAKTQENKHKQAT
nr:hypothetical protein [Tanacetum cinerariifolium]